MFKWLGLFGASVEITLCDDDFMTVQNRRFMGKRGTTDVLSFPQLTTQTSPTKYQGQFLGDILVSLDQAARQAKLQKSLLRREVLFLIMHSILHLLGHDHGSAVERQKMQALESLIWINLRRK